MIDIVEFGSDDYIAPGSVGIYGEEGGEGRKDD
jgi:hypothetical protein